MRNGFSIYDTHTHIGEARHSGRADSADALLRNMDRAGVDRSLVIPYPVVDDYRAAHDLIGRAVERHPDRLAGAACPPVFIPEREYRDEVARCAGQYGFRALKLQPQYQALNPLSSRSDFVFETALAHRLTLICHTGAGIPYALPSLFMMPARKLPELNIVLAHAGGGIFTGEAIVAATFCPNIYLELSSLMPHHVASVLAHVAASRLMIGSDLPENLDIEIGKILALDIPDEARAEILWRTPRRLFDGVEG